VERKEGEPLVYENVEKLKEDYGPDIVRLLFPSLSLFKIYVPMRKSSPPKLLKSTLTTSLNSLLEPIRADFAASPEWQAIEQQAYPPEKAVVKVKKPKDKGDPAKRAAAVAARKEATGVVAQPDEHVEGPEKEKVT